jgi:hypothetical protein
MQITGYRLCPFGKTAEHCIFRTYDDVGLISSHLAQGEGFA